MSREAPRHTKAPPPQAFDVDMFSGERKDTRTRKQKTQDFTRQFKQPLMFAQGEISQFGVNPHPLLPISDKTRLGLEMFDLRTDEEKERDLEREAQKRTIQLFPQEPEPDGEYLDSQQTTPITDPRRLLAATSVVPDVALQNAQEYERLKGVIEQDMHEKRYFLHLLFQR